MNRHIIAQVSLLFAGVALLACIVWRDLAPSGSLVESYNLYGYHPWISKVFPEGRLTAAVLNNEGFTQTVLAEPVYFYVRLPRHMDSVHVKIPYQSRQLPSLKIGLQRQPQFLGDTWRYDFRDVPQNTTRDGEWQIVDQTFSLQNAEVNDGRLRFILSAPGLKEGSSFALHRIDIELNGPSYGVGQAITSALRRLSIKSI